MGLQYICSCVSKVVELKFQVCKTAHGCNDRWAADVETPQTLVIDLMCTNALANHINILWEVWKT